MDMKKSNPGIYGVVADLVSTDKRYETAIEIALGGSVKNLVVDTEDTAKKLIAYLKRERLGRATFLPVSSVHGNAGIPDGALNERGVIGTADTLVRHDSRYDGIFAYLLGGAMTGGAYRRSDNLLGRKRQLDELSEQCQRLTRRLEEINESMDDSTRKREEAAAAEKEKRDEFNSILIDKKNKEHDLSILNEQKADEQKAYEDIIQEEADIRKKLSDMEDEQNSYDEKLSEIHLKESDIAVRSDELEKEKKRIEGSIERLRR